MKPDLSFLSRVRTTLENLWGGGQPKTQPLKVTKQPLNPAPEQTAPQYSYTDYDPQYFEMKKRMFERNAGGQVLGAQSPTATPTPTMPQQAIPIPNPTLPAGSDLAMEFIQSQMPQSQRANPQAYFPALADPGFMQGLAEADRRRQGLQNLLLLQSFFESTLGRGGRNYFGALPGGEGAGVSPSFNSPSSALNYQLSPAVLGGGANPNMNILNTDRPISRSDIETLYKSYDPNQAYLAQLLGALFNQ